ncbi:MAG: Ni/Fe hydrogenase subunit alpha [Desulfovibrionales bacterium]
MSKSERKKETSPKKKPEQKSGKRIDVHYLTRVEGHGNIVVEIDPSGVVRTCRWEVPEAPRFFEAMLTGRPFRDVHQITSRICGICSIGHQVASIQATEEALGVPVSTQTMILRKLALHAENLQSHLLHIGYLVLPDLLGVGSVLPLAECPREELLDVIGSRRVSNEFSRIICGRTTHPQSLIPGGMAQVPSQAELRDLSGQLKEAGKRLARVVALFASLAEKWPRFDRPTEYVALSSPGEYAFYRGEIVSSKDQRRPASRYRDLANEYCVRHSTAKWAKNVEKSYMVGALARFNVNSEYLHPAAKKAAAELGLAAPCTNPYYNTAAQLVECVHSVEDSFEKVDHLLTTGIRQEEPEPIAPKPGRGVGAVEVPRGILFHAYEYDSRGRIVRADCVIPTNQNHGNIQQDFDAIIPSLAKKTEDEIELTLSMLVRAYDPCISCSTHMVDVAGKNRKSVRFVRIP